MDAKPSRLFTVTASLFLVSLIVFILYIGRDLILPFVLALVIWYVIVQFSHLFHQLHWRKKPLSWGLCYAFSILSAFAFLYTFMSLLTASIGNIINEAPAYQAKLNLALTYLNQWTGSQLKIAQLVNSVNLTALFSKIASTISNLIGNFTLVLIYLLFLGLETKSFNSKIDGLCANATQRAQTYALITLIEQDINVYLKAKTLLNVVAGVASYIILRLIHIPYAEFWGMIIFLMHFIPFIGPIIAVLLVMLAASIQINNMLVFGLLACVLVTIQFVVGNVLEPKWLGNRLNLSPIIILLSLAFWGTLWGIVGMFLCVPLMVILNIVFAHFKSTRFIAVLLSADPVSLMRGHVSN